MFMPTIANHSEPFLLRSNLQFFAGEEVVDVPAEESQESPSFEETDDFLSFEDELESAEDSTPAAVDLEEEEATIPNEQVEEHLPSSFKVKFNHEEQEIGYDDAVPLIQKGMNYDKLQERLQQLETDPRLSFIEEMAKEAGMDTQQFLDYAKQSREQAKLDELIQQNIPEEYAREILESKKFREEQQQEKQRQQEEQKRNEEFKEFFQFFKEANERDFDPKTDQIPPEVWQRHEQGVPLRYAYMEQHMQQLQNQLKTYKQNDQNAKRATVGSLTNLGTEEPASEDDFLKGFNSI